MPPLGVQQQIKKTTQHLICTPAAWARSQYEDSELLVESPQNQIRELPLPTTPTLPGILTGIEEDQGRSTSGVVDLQCLWEHEGLSNLG